MRLQRSTIDTVYNDIQIRSLSCNGISVLVFVACDVDSIFSARILCSLFDMNAVRYIVRPVIDYQDLRVSLSELCSEHDDLKSIVLINALGMLDIVRWADVRPDSQLQFYVFDSHRPLNVENLSGANAFVTVITDEDEIFPPDAMPDESAEDFDLQKSDIFGDDDEDLELEPEEREFRRERRLRAFKRRKMVCTL